MMAMGVWGCVVLCVMFVFGFFSGTNASQYSQSLMDKALKTLSTLVLVGGGHAHLFVLEALLERGVPAGWRVVLVSPNRYQYYSGMLPSWMAGHYALEECRVDLQPLFARLQRVVGDGRAQWRMQKVVAMDAEAQTVQLEDGSALAYDALSLDVGSGVRMPEMLAYSSGSQNAFGDLGALGVLLAKPLDVFFHEWQRWCAFVGSNNSVGSEERPQRIAVLGGGAAGVELALAAAYRFGDKAQITLYAGNSGVLSSHSAAVQQRVQTQLQAVGVDVRQNRCDALEQQATGYWLVCGGAGSRADEKADVFDGVLVAAGARAHGWLADTGVVTGLQVDTRGYVAVDAQHRSVSHLQVFAAGDCCARVDVDLEKSGVHAVHAGPVLAENLLAVMRRDVPSAAYQPKARSLYLLACGRRYAIASWGSWSVQGRLWWYVKRWIDLRFMRRWE